MVLLSVVVLFLPLCETSSSACPLNPYSLIRTFCWHWSTLSLSHHFLVTPASFVSHINSALLLILRKPSLQPIFSFSYCLISLLPFTTKCLDLSVLTLFFTFNSLTPSYKNCSCFSKSTTWPLRSIWKCWVLHLSNLQLHGYIID